jgi:hypothetical protein
MFGPSDSINNYIVIQSELGKFGKVTDANVDTRKLSIGSSATIT